MFFVCLPSIQIPCSNILFFSSIGLYFVMLVVSVGLMTQIKMSSKPPQLFKDSTNLQMMLDLKANLSIDKFSCPTCSGFFQSDHQVSSLVQPNIGENEQNTCQVGGTWCKRRGFFKKCFFFLFFAHYVEYLFDPWICKECAYH